MPNTRELIYKDEARSAVLHEHPAIAFCIDRLKPVDAVPLDEYNKLVEELKFTREFLHEHGLDFAAASAWGRRKKDGK